MSWSICRAFVLVQTVSNCNPKRNLPESRAQLWSKTAAMPCISPQQYVAAAAAVLQQKVDKSAVDLIYPE